MRWRILFTKLNRYDTSGNKVIKSVLHLPRLNCHVCFYKGVTVPQKSDTSVNIMRGNGIPPSGNKTARRIPMRGHLHTRKMEY